VHGESMRPSLEPGDRLVVVRTRRPRPGQVVALDDPRQPGRVVVKRVAAAGDAGVTVVGDNPAASTDSRHYGPVPATVVRGRAVWRYWPESRRGRL
jgi:nickel-type superoxide dismutase maturation protease